LAITKGFELSGVAKISHDETFGTIMSGVFNYTNSNANGLQLSTINIVVNEMNGFQLGVFNYANKLKGVQLGVFNYVGHASKALPIGVFSIVKNG